MQTLPPELNDRKVSEVFSDYIEPFLLSLLQSQSHLPMKSLQEFQAVLKIPWCIWNASVIKNHAKEALDYIAEMKRLAKNFPIDTLQWIDDLRERIETHFKQYDYLIGTYKLYRHVYFPSITHSITKHQ